MPDTYVNAERLGYFKDKVDEKIEADLSSKADKTGSYPDLTAGNAAQLIGTVYTEDKTPYKFRTTGGSIDVGNRADDTIVGGSIVWNQNLEGDFSNPDNWVDIAHHSTHSVADGILTVVAAASGASKGCKFKNYKFIDTHTYLTRGYVKSSVNTQFRVGATSAAGGAVLIPKTMTIEPNTLTVYEHVLKINQSTATGILIYTDASNQQAIGDTVELSKWQLFDLTQMFGSTIADYIYSLEQATAGAGVAWFRKLFPDDYYPYNPGEIMSVSGLTSHDMVGFNLFDKTTSYKVGYSYRYIDTLIGKSNELHMEFVDKDTSIDVSDINIGFVKTNNGSPPSRFRWAMASGVIRTNRTNTASQDVSVYCPYVFVYPQSDDAWDRLNRRYDININLSWSGYRNGEYEPYVKHSYPLDSMLTLRGIPKLDVNNNLYYDGDIYKSDGTVTRKYGVVDLGTLTWAYENSRFEAILPTTPKKYSTRSSFICSLYTFTGTSGDVDKTGFIGASGTARELYIYDSSYTDAATFKAAMSGAYLVYELATPTTETAAPYTNPQIVDDFGTEEYVTDSIVPVGHITKYPENLRDKLQHLPDLASTDGSYLLTQSNKKMSLSPYVAPTIPPFPTPDTTLTVECGYAEAKTVGDEITGLKEDLNELESQLTQLDELLFESQLLNGWDTVNYVTGYLNNNGNIITNAQFRTTDYIPVSENDVISYKLSGYNSEVYIVTAYDSSKTRIGASSVVGVTGFSTGTYTVPSGVSFVRLSSGGYASATFTSEDAYGTKQVSVIDEIEETLEGKVDIQQSSADAGKALVIGNDGKVSPQDVSVQVDATLSQSGKAADAKAVGDAIDEVAIHVLLNGWSTVDWTTGYINSSGTVTSNGSFRNTDFIPVSENDVISYKLSGYNSEVYVVTAYDSSKTRIANNSLIGESAWKTGTYTVAEGTAYIRISSGNVNSATFSSDTIITNKITPTKEYVDDAVGEVSDRVETIESEIEPLVNVGDDVASIKANYVLSPNMLDPTKCTDASAIGAGYIWSPYMPVIAGERYTLWSDGGVYKVYWYNSAKASLSNLTINGRGFEKIAPENASFMRVVYKESSVTKIMVAHGVVGNYVPYGALLQEEELPDYVVRDTNNVNNPEKYVEHTNINSNGEVTEYASSRSTDFIQVEEGETYYIGGENDRSANKTGAAAYDTDHEFVEEISSFPYTVPTGIAFIRIGYSIPAGNVTSVCVRKGQVGVSGMMRFDAYDTFRLENTKPSTYERSNGLYGLKWNAMGDSITEGSGTTKSYRTLISERTGIINRNYGVSNTAIAKRGASSTNDMCLRYSDMDDDADIITVFGGTNDHGNNIPIGQWGDNTVDTVYGAMKILVEGLINKYMGKKIGFITPLPKYNTNNNTDFSYPSASFKPYIDCIKDVCMRYSIPVLDLYVESGISPAMQSVRTAMIPDGLHPNIVGHELISWHIQRFLERI